MLELEDDAASQHYDVTSNPSPAWTMEVKISAELLEILSDNSPPEMNITLGMGDQYCLNVDGKQFLFSSSDVGTPALHELYCERDESFREVGKVHKKIALIQHLTHEMRDRIKIASQTAEKTFRPHNTVLLKPKNAKPQPNKRKNTEAPTANSTPLTNVNAPTKKKNERWVPTQNTFETTSSTL